MSETAVFSVIFPKNLSFFRAFLDSLKRQTYKSFDLFLLVDGIDNIEDGISEFRQHLNIITHLVSGTISEVRHQGVNLLLDAGYTNVIFADTDDVMTDERVEVCVRNLAKYDFVVNDISPFYGTIPDLIKGYWSERLPDNFEFSQSDISNYNFVGLGNAAARTACLKKLDFPPHLKIIDWFLFYHWLADSQGVFTHSGKVLYRQQGDNLAGVGKIDAVKLMKIFSFRIEHYAALVSNFPELRKQLDFTSQLFNLFSWDQASLDAAVDKIKISKINYFWWEEPLYVL